MGALRRRDFLLGAVASPAFVAAAPPAGRKLLLVVFGGGARSSETMGHPERRYIPRVGRELARRATVWTNLRVEGRVVHPNQNATIKTGHLEYDDLDWSRPPAHPTLFEIVRKRRSLPDTAAWSFVYAEILAKTGESRAADYGPAFAANVVLPPTIPRAAAEEMERQMSLARATGQVEAEVEAAGRCASLARQAARLTLDGLRSPAARRWVAERFEAWRRSSGTTSHDAFLAELAIACMERFAPEILSVDFGEIDSAHYGSWSRYVDAIGRTDALTARLWEAAERLPAYRDQTLLLVVPDHGRELERPGGTGFLHHSDFYSGENADEGCRRSWLLARGPGMPEGRQIDRPFAQTKVAATALEHLFGG